MEKVENSTHGRGLCVKTKNAIDFAARLAPQPKGFLVEQQNKPSTP
jgi:hypothetical protein